MVLELSSSCPPSVRQGRVLVTGGAGFVGRYVVLSLQNAGYTPVVFDIAAEPGPASIRGDLRNAADVMRACEGVEYVCHLGGVGDIYLAMEQPALAAECNVAGTANVMHAASCCRVRKVIYASTWEVYGKPQYQPVDEDHPCRPDHPYNITKLAGEQLALSCCRFKNVPVVSLRLGTIYGDGMRPNSVFSIFIRKAIRREPITIKGDGRQFRQFLHGSDAGDAFVRAMEANVTGECFNIVGEERITIRALAESVAARLPTEICHEEGRLGDIESSFVASAKARAGLGWTQRVAFGDGLNMLVDEARTGSQQSRAAASKLQTA